MKRLAFVFLAAVMVSTTGCLKDRDASGCNDVPVANEAPAIQAYASANSIPAVPHSSGIYYQVITPGSGPTPTTSSKIYVTYTGKLLNGTVFDSGTTPAGGWLLSGLIPGWQIGIPLIQKGGSIRLLIPSALAYGCRGVGAIPPNSILDFEVTLTDVQ